MAAPRPFEPEDLLRFQLVRDVQIADTGDLAIELKEIDAAADTYRSSIWIARGGGAPIARGAAETSPRWAPGGERLAMIVDRGERPAQLGVAETAEASARVITELPGAVVSCAWSPRGDLIAFTASVDREPAPGGDRDATRWKHRPRVVDRQRYQSDGTGFLLHSHTHLFVVDAAGGPPRQLTRGRFDVTAPAFSPDGSRVVFTRSRDGVRDAHLSDVWTIERDGTGARRWTTGVVSATAPAWSPDGRLIVCTGATEEGDSITYLWIVDTRDGTVARLGTAELSTFPLQRSWTPCWSADGARVAFLLAHDGLTAVATCTVADGAVAMLTNGLRQVASVHASRAGIAFTSVGAGEPGDAHVIDWNGDGERRASSFNDGWWYQRGLPRIERRAFVVPGDVPASGWLLSPPDGGAGPRPLLVDVHGGPHSFAELGFPYHVYWYVLCARGWSVLALDATGSSSYGPERAARLRGHWGELDLPQHLAVVEQLRADGIADDRIAIAGKSYGGFLAAWAIGHTDAFRAAVVSAPVADQASHCGTSDSGYYVGPFDMGAEPWEDPDRYHALSAVSHAHRATTPTLILQGEDDRRCPIGQAQELFARLMRAGRAPVEMVLYPEGHHDLAEDGTPSHRVDYHRRIVAWLERWCRR